MKTHPFTRRGLLKTVGTGVFASLAAPSILRAASPDRLTFGTFVGPTNVLNTQIFGPWMDEIKAASGGSLDFHVQSAGAAPKPSEMIDAVRAGIIDIGWSSTSYNPGRFVTAGIAELPEIYKTPTEGALAMNALLEAGKMDGFDGVKILMLATSGISYLHHREQISGLSAFNGAKVRAAGNIASTLLEALGATPVGMPITSAPEALSRGIVDAVLCDWFAIEGFQLAAVTKSHLDLGAGAACIYMVMNQRSYDKLSDAAKAALDSRDILSTSMFWADRLHSNGERIRTETLATPGHILFEPSQEEAAIWTETGERIVKEWATKTQGGDEALEILRAAVAKSRNG